MQGRARGVRSASGRRPAPRLPPDERRKDPPGPEGAEVAAGHAGDPAGGAVQVGRGGEVQQANDGCGAVGGVLQQLGGAGDPREVDHPLQVGRAAGGELAGEVLPADAEPASQSAGPYRSFDLAQGRAAFVELPGGDQVGVTLQERRGDTVTIEVALASRNTQSRLTVEKGQRIVHQVTQEKGGSAFFLTVTAWP